MDMRKSLVGLLALMMVGCSGPVIDDPVEEVTHSASPSPEPTEVITVPPEPTENPEPEPEPSQGEPHVDAENISPDPELVASMECEPLNPETEARIESLWGEAVIHGVQVEVGDGLTAGEVWWIVAYSSTSSEFGERSNVALTNHPGVPSERGTWHTLGAQVVNAKGELAYTWDGIHWDAERLARGQSALARALGCSVDD